MKCLQAYALMAMLTLVFGALPVSAEELSAEAFLDGLQMVPPNASPAFGSLVATLDDQTGAFTITTGSYQDLLGGAANAQLRSGAAGDAGTFLFNLTLDTPGAATGTYSGGGVLTAPQIVDMIAGNTFVRISSSVFPGGELRGQIAIVPEPASIAMLAAGMVALVAIARRTRRALKM